MALREIAGSNPPRRWFTSSDMDLFLWVDENGELQGFQLSYDKPRAEKSLAWTSHSGFTHDSVDDGEAAPGAKYKGTPLLRRGGKPDVNYLVSQLRHSGDAVPHVLLEKILLTIERYPDR